MCVKDMEALSPRNKDHASQRYFVVLEKDTYTDREELFIRTQNEGMAIAEVILSLEAWLSMMKETVQKPIRDNFTAFNKG